MKLWSTRPRTRVASILFLDLVGFSKATVNEQIEIKRALSGIVRRTLRFATPEDYRLMDTGDGVGIGFMSDPEHALYAALSIVATCRATDPVVGLRPEHLRIGINLGPVKEVVDVNDRPTLIGDGVNAAERVMSFAKPGEITVARSFQESVALLAPEYQGIFEDIGAHGDKHGRKHAVYLLKPGDDLLEKISRRLGGPDDAALGPDSIAAPGATPFLDLPEPVAAPPGSEPTYLMRGDASFERASSRAGVPHSASARRWMIPVAVVVVAMVAAAVWGVWNWEQDREAAKPVTTAKPATTPARIDPLPVAGDAKPVSTAAEAGKKTIAPTPTGRTEDVAKSAAPPAAMKADAGTKSGPVTPQKAVDAAPKTVPATAEKSASAAGTTAVPVTKAAPAEGRPPVVVAPRQPADRCGQLLQRASLGEPLTNEEKRELAEICR